MGIHVKTAAGWEELGVSGTPGELPGLGGWAEITSVSGSPKRYAYNDGPGGVGGMDWVAFEWTDTTDPSPNSLTTLNGGLVDALIVGSGGWADGTNNPGGAGGVQTGIRQVPDGRTSVTVGAGGTSGSIAYGQVSWLGSIFAGGGGYGVSNADNSIRSGYGGGSGTGSRGLPSGSGQGAGMIVHPNQNANPTDVRKGIVSSITESAVEYAQGGHSSRPTPAGSGGYQGNGRAGVVVVKVPAAQAAGVPASEYVDVP